MGLDSRSTWIGIVIGVILGFILFMVFYFCQDINGRDDLEKSKRTVSSQRYEISTLQSQLEVTKTTLRSSQDVISRQTNELRQMASLRADNGNLQNEVASLIGNVQRLESENQSLQTAQDRLTRSRQEARAHVARLEPFEREATNLRSQIQDFDRERGTLLRRQEESALKLRETEQRLETLRERFQYVNEEVAERDLRLQTSLAQIELLRGGAESGVG
jgi:chromosome segregation ATPase